MLEGQDPRAEIVNHAEQTASVCSVFIPNLKCGVRTTIKIYEDTVLRNFPLYCTKCKQETRLGVIKCKIAVSDEPDA